MQTKALHSNAKQCTSKHCTPKHCTAVPSNAYQRIAQQCKAMFTKALHSNAKQCIPRPCKQCKAMQTKALHSKGKTRSLAEDSKVQQRVVTRTIVAMRTVRDYQPHKCREPCRRPQSSKELPPGRLSAQQRVATRTVVAVRPCHQHKCREPCRPHSPAKSCYQDDCCHAFHPRLPAA